MAASKIPHKSVSRRKLALVIGIGDYKYTKKLKNAVNDAEAMASTLKRIGFNVTHEINLTHDEMDDALHKFKKSIKGGEMVLFFFAGHGIQWEVCTYDL